MVQTRHGEGLKVFHGLSKAGLYDIQCFKNRLRQGNDERPEDANDKPETKELVNPPFDADPSAGAAINYKNTKMSYALVYRTKEFDEQDDAQVFGTVSLNWTF